MATLSASKKRKMHDDDNFDDTHEDSDTVKNKKPKLLSDTALPGGKAKASPKLKLEEDKESKAVVGDQSTDEYPNGFFYCHQCTRKRDNSCECIKQCSRDAN